MGKRGRFLFEKFGHEKRGVSKIDIFFFAKKKIQIQISILIARFHFQHFIQLETN